MPVFWALYGQGGPVGSNALSNVLGRAWEHRCSCTCVACPCACSFPCRPGHQFAHGRHGDSLRHGLEPTSRYERSCAIGVCLFRYCSCFLLAKQVCPFEVFWAGCLLVADGSTATSARAEPADRLCAVFWLPGLAASAPSCRQYEGLIAVCLACVDLQAQARAHRIGQKRPVTVYRMVRFRTDCCSAPLVLLVSYGVFSVLQNRARACATAALPEVALSVTPHPDVVLQDVKHARETREQQHAVTFGFELPQELIGDHELLRGFHHFLRNGKHKERKISHSIKVTRKFTARAVAHPVTNTTSLQSSRFRVTRLLVGDLRALFTVSVAVGAFSSVLTDVSGLRMLCVGARARVCASPSLRGARAVLAFVARPSSNLIHARHKA